MSEDADRRAELIGAALAGELSSQEQTELDEACRRDPSILEGLAGLRQVLDRVDAAGREWSEAEPEPDLADRVAAIADAPAPQEGAVASAPVSTGPPRGGRSRGLRARALQAVAAACLVAVGVVGTLTYQGIAEKPPDGPPGTLGAVEEIDFAGEPTGSEIEGSLVAHTWGTETVLEVDGLEVGETFEVVLVSESGEELSSGAFIGARATVTCRMNAAVMREDVAQVRIDSEDEDVHLVADLPEAT